MTIEGYGGPIGSATSDANILAGLIDVKPRERLPHKRCANPLCARYFRPRADGDSYCREACDLDHKTRREQ